MKKRTKAIEDYLEAILILEANKEPTQSIKIANFLKVSKPAVTRAMNELENLGYITKDENKLIVLTPSGKTIATKTYKKHRLLKEFLIELGVSTSVAEHDCCLIEHVISDETIKQIEKFLEDKKK